MSRKCRGSHLDSLCYRTAFWPSWPEAASRKRTNVVEEREEKTRNRLVILGGGLRYGEVMGYSAEDEDAQIYSILRGKRKEEQNCGLFYFIFYTIGGDSLFLRECRLGKHERSSPKKASFFPPSSLMCGLIFIFIFLKRCKVVLFLGCPNVSTKNVVRVISAPTRISSTE